MTDEQTPAPPPSSDPPPLAPLVEQASAPATQAAPPPPVAWAPAPPAAIAAAGGRTGLAAAAGVLLIVLGILGGLAGLAVALIGGSFAATLGDLIEVPGLNGADAGAVFGGVIAFVGVLILVYSLVYVFAGVGVLRNRGWGRVMGLVVGILSGLIWLGTVTTPDQPGVQESIVGSLIALGIHVYIVVALLLFWRSKAATA
jgi:hypothetical protein